MRQREEQKEEEEGGGKDNVVQQLHAATIGRKKNSYWIQRLLVAGSLPTLRHPTTVVVSAELIWVHKKMEYVNTKLLGNTTV